MALDGPVPTNDEAANEVKSDSSDMEQSSTPMQEENTLKDALHALDVRTRELEKINRALTDGTDELEITNEELRAAEAQLRNEIEDRERADEALHILNRTLTAHGKSDQVMMRAQSETEYLNEVCHIIIEDCGHAMVWIGYAEDDEEKSVRPVAYSGFEEGYLETLGITWADSERGRGPTGTAVRTGKPSMCRNMLTDPQFEPWRKQAVERGYASSIVLPLTADGKAFGVISIYSRDPDPFTEDEVTLLAGLTNDLAYGITAIRLREESARAEVEIKRNEARLESLLKISQHRADSIQEFLDAALEEAIALTGSKIGYIYHYDETRQEFTLNSWSKGVMDQCSVTEQQTVYALEKTGLWGEAVRQAKPIIVNDFHAPHPLKKGYPEGHNTLHRFLTVPVVVDERIVGVVGVANKQTDYDNSDVRQLTLLMDSAWKFTERKRVEEALRESEQRVRLKLDSILLPEGDIGSLELSDILDVPSVQSLMDSFYSLAHIPMAIINLKAKVLVGVGWQDICTKFHRIHPETCKYCFESDLELTAGLLPGESKLYKCKNNMWDIATPIIIGGEHVGNLFSGQFFFDDEPLDYELFRLQAKRYGFDEEDYIAALESVPRLSRESVDDGMEFFMKLAEMLSKLSYGNVKLARSLAERDSLINERMLAEEEAAEARADAERRAGQLESFISSMVDGILLFDSELRALIVNDALKKLLGAPIDVPSEIYMGQYELYTLDCEPVLLEDYPSRRALRGEETKTERFRMITPWNESVVGISGSPVMDGQGLVIGGTLSFHDVTGLVELEEYKEELYNREHHIAEVLQQALIPPEVPTQIGDFRIGVRYQPALREAEVGGDFYDVFDVGNGKTGVLIGDVAGKGLAAAIRVAAARYSVRSYALIDPRPSHVMTLANEALCKDSGEESSILTAFFAVIDSSTGRVTYSSAGHEPPVVCRASGAIEELLLGGLPFGVQESSTYREDVLDLAPGDTLVLVTDGITEARAGGHTLFEKEGMVRYLSNKGEISPDETAFGLLEAATAHAGGQLQDDAAIVVVMLEQPCHAGCAASG